MVRTISARMSAATALCTAVPKREQSSLAKPSDNSSTNSCKKRKKKNLVTRKGVRTKRAQALYDFPTIPSFVLIETYHPTHNGYRVVLIQTAIATNKRAAVQGPNVRLNKFFSNEPLPELPPTLFAYERRAHEIRHFHFSPLTKIVSLLFWPEIISAGCSTLCYKGDIFGLSPKVPTV